MSAISRNESSGSAAYVTSSVVGPSSVLLAAGIRPLDADGAVVGAGDVVAQTNQCLVNLATDLSAHGATLADLTTVTVYVAERLQADLQVAWDAVVAAAGDDPPPISVVGVTVLLHDEQVVELEATAVLPA